MSDFFFDVLGHGVPSMLSIGGNPQFVSQPTIKTRMFGVAGPYASREEADTARIKRMVEGYYCDDVREVPIP
jgi:hypothetical protein